MLFYHLVSSHHLMIIPWDECHGTSPMISQHWFRSAPSHYLGQCWPSSMSPYGVIRPQCVLIFINWMIRNTLQWNLNPDFTFIFHENAFGNVVRKMATILFRCHCDNNTLLWDICHQLSGKAGIPRFPSFYITATKMLSSNVKALPNVTQASSR